MVPGYWSLVSRSKTLVANVSSIAGIFIAFDHNLVKGNWVLAIKSVFFAN
jgi:hypothetical protein